MAVGRRKIGIMVAELTAPGVSAPTLHAITLQALDGDVTTCQEVTYGKFGGVVGELSASQEGCLARLSLHPDPELNSPPIDAIYGRSHRDSPPFSEVQMVMLRLNDYGVNSPPAGVARVVWGQAYYEEV